MAIEVKKLNSMSVTVATVGAAKYDITSDVTFNNNAVNRFEMGKVKTAGNTEPTENIIANFSSNGYLSITYQNIKDIVVMKEIMDAIDAFITEVKNTPPANLSEVTPTI